MNPERWLLLMESLAVADSGDEYEKLVAAYTEPHRHYHNARHVADCLTRLDEYQAEAESPAEVEVALWFHDVVYKPRSTSNEIDSAERARVFFAKNGVDEDKCGRVCGHILATRHACAPEGGDSGLVVDIDLSILGRPVEKYVRFEKNVRREYKWVPYILFKRKRKEILQSFLDREVIYVNSAVREDYEVNARRNLKSAIEDLSR